MSKLTDAERTIIVNTLTTATHQYEKDADCKKVLDEIKPFEKTLSDYANQPKLSDANIGPLKDAINGLRGKFL